MFPSGEFFDPWHKLLGLHYHPLPGQPTGLRQQEWRTGRAALSRACLWQARERPRMVFTFSLLSFWWPGRPAVTPLRFVGPRECLHYITPHTTAPRTHTHPGTGSGAHTLTHALSTRYTCSLTPAAGKTAVSGHFLLPPPIVHSFPASWPPSPRGTEPGLLQGPRGTASVFVTSREVDGHRLPSKSLEVCGDGAGPQRDWRTGWPDRKRPGPRRQPLLGRLQKFRTASREQMGGKGLRGTAGWEVLRACAEGSQDGRCQRTFPSTETRELPRSSAVLPFGVRRLEMLRQGNGGNDVCAASAPDLCSAEAWRPSLGPSCWGVPCHP